MAIYKVNDTVVSGSQRPYSISTSGVPRLNGGGYRVDEEEFYEPPAEEQSVRRNREGAQIFSPRGSTAKERVFKRRDLYADMEDKQLDRYKKYVLEEESIEQRAEDDARAAYVERQLAGRDAAAGSAADGLASGDAQARLERLEQSYQEALRRIQTMRARELTAAQNSRTADIQRYRREFERAVERL